MPALSCLPQAEQSPSPIQPFPQKEDSAFCADYCFVKDSRDDDMATVLAGRLYPSMAVLATVVDAKGLQDATATARLTQFIRESGVT